MNCDNFLGDRPSTRVHAPPGGASSICFGGYDDAPAPARTGRRAAPASYARESAPVAAACAPVAAAPARAAAEPLRESNSAALAAAMATAATAVPAARKPAAGGMAESSNKFANGANQNAGNFITDRPTTRLHAPPGGHSSFSLGWA